MIPKLSSKRMTFTFAIVVLCYSANAVTAAANNLTDQVPPVQPPLVFPDDGSKYKILPNNPTIALTLSHNNESNSETYDMVHDMKAVKDTEDIEKKFQKVIPLNGVDDIDYSVNPKLQSEIIQMQGAIVEKDTIPQDKPHNTVEHWSVITISSIMIITIVAILAIYTWKKMVSRKYSSRQILINEEDPPSNSHF